MQGFLTFSKMQRLNQFSKKSRIDKENYSPVRILPVISKIFERLVFKQLTMFFETVFSKYRCLLTMTEKWKKCLDSNGACGALLTDLSKAFDCLPHSLLIAKHHAYEFEKTSTKYLKDY